MNATNLFRRPIFKYKFSQTAQLNSSFFLYCQLTTIVATCTTYSVIYMPFTAIRTNSQAESTWQEVNEMEIDSMTQTELASYLETLAKLVEATAKDAQDAARIIREAIPKQ